MSDKCMTCGNLITENFCGNCGQRKNKRINKTYILDELQDLYAHTNKGFYYTLKKTAINPGKTAREFIEGSRVNHYKPLMFALALSGIASFLSYQVIGLNDIFKETYKSMGLNNEFSNDIIAFLASNNALLMLALLPFFAILTKIVFRKWGENYYEHVVMNSFILSFYTISSILLIYPLMYFFKNDLEIIFKITSLSFLLLPFILFFFYKNYYPTKSVKLIIWKIFLIFLLMILSYIVLIIIFSLIVGLMIVINPEFGNYFRKS
ncbi:DUF3667 domain-containing protein [Empedobacter falsenii]|uniref:DUF3667 domain-containing protein n=1 Tax=Empedobacter sp. UBA7248 TaxID=1946448 RepID=UPI0025BD137E|nr:DUF3667 domain-containing protein [Empedobacter sp. UBA7248]